MGGPTYDVAIIGGGPGGSTTGAMLRKYHPGLKVVILEREKFPREHIGESQLPPIGRVLDEMGAWEKVEAANFVIKLGATYTWGKTTEPWTFGFIPLADVRNDPRPAPYAGWRTRVALQVERSKYDTILLDHAASLGCEVRQETRVASVEHDGDTVTGLRLDSGGLITANYYVDASGNSAVLRRDMGVKVDAPTLLRNVAFWDYWEAKGTNRALLETSTVRIHIRSLPYGWVWFIALSEDLTSVGVVCPAEFYKNCGKRPEQLYDESLKSDALVQKLLGASRAQGKVRSTNDWSFISERAYGNNWFLVGESLGFADPILSAGLTLTHTCARHCAYVILELLRGQHDRAWLCTEYDRIQRRRVVQHMRFAEYWYSANGFFSAIHENCSRIARESGIKLTPAEAFRWLSNGGIDDEVGQVAIGGLDLAGIKQVQWRLSEPGHKVEYLINNKNVFKLNLAGAEKVDVPVLSKGQITRATAYQRGPIQLPLVGAYGMLVDALQKTGDGAEITAILQQKIGAQYAPEQRANVLNQTMMCLEAMANNYWVTCSVKKGRPVFAMVSPREGEIVYSEKTGPQAL